ncbi:MAG TPA: hypothetical protein PKC65_02300 [Pyrinomonadaceae bacterium]|nr:hypothetical protein [Acidobacteriota bacterium]HMM78832.1 hypothetical protein [Pyrinomonadaceae bacterium]
MITKRTVFIWSVLVLLTLFHTFTAFSQGGPPMITDDTETVPRGHFEINTAFTLERGFDTRLFSTPLLDINYGLSRNTQLKVEIPWLVLHRNGQLGIQGLGNTNIGVRWRFRDDDKKHRVAMSIYPQFEFNNPSSSVRRGVVDKGPEFLMPMQWQTKIGKFAVGGDVGYRLKRGPDEIIYGLIVGKQFRSLELMSEIHGTGPKQQLGKSQIAFNLGSRAKLSNHLTLLLSGGRSIRPGYDPRFIGYAGLRVDF